MSRQDDRAARAVAQWRDQMPDLPVEAMEVFGRLREIALRLGRDLSGPVHAAHGLDGGEFDVLATLRRAGPPFALTPTALTDALMLSSGGMTARLDRLEIAGLVRRRPNPADRRGTLVELTEPGRTLIEGAVRAGAAAQTDVFSRLPPADRAQLARLLADLMAALPDPGASAG